MKLKHDKLLSNFACFGFNCNLLRQYDLDGDGYPELIAADTRGSVAAFRRDGTELWERHLSSLIAQGVTLGDVDGDGELEVAVGTSSGAIHVLRGSTGVPMKPFPFYTQGRVMVWRCSCSFTLL